MPENTVRPPAPPTDAAQARADYYSQSFLEVLSKSIGNFVVCEFLIGSNSLVEKYGILTSAGNNYLTLYDREYDNTTVCDFYSLKFITIYNTKVRPPQFVPRQQFRQSTRMR